MNTLTTTQQIEQTRLNTFNEFCADNNIVIKHNTNFKIMQNETFAQCRNLEQEYKALDRKNGLALINSAEFKALKEEEKNELANADIKAKQEKEVALLQQQREKEYAKKEAEEQAYNASLKAQTVINAKKEQIRKEKAEMYAKGEITLLNVPFSDKDIVKKLGCEWNGKNWFYYNNAKFDWVQLKTLKKYAS